MLVLSRKMGQKLQIGTDITVTVLKTQGNTVRLGIEAPRDVRVRRAELPPLPEDTTEPAKARILGSIGAQEKPLLRFVEEVKSPSPKPSPSERPNPTRWSVDNMEQRVRATPSKAPLAAKLASI